MKKIFLLLTLSFMFITSCSDPKPETYNPANGQIAYFTGGTIGEYYVQDIPNPSTQIEVGVTVVSTVDRAIAVSVDPSTTANANQYSIDDATLFIPANSYVGYIKIKFGAYENYSPTDPATLVLNLDTVGGAIVPSFDNTFTLDILQFTPFVRDDLLGTYTVTEYETEDGVEKEVDKYESEVIAGEKDNEVILGNLYNAEPSSQTILILDDSDPTNFKIKFPPFLNNFLFSSANNGDIFVEGFEGKFSAGLKTLDFTYRLRFGLDNTGSSNTATYRVEAVFK